MKKCTTEYNPDHYAFRRSISGFYPETKSDKWGDRMVVIVAVIAIGIFALGFTG